MAKTDDAAARAAQQQQIEELKAALEPLARISPLGERKAAPVGTDAAAEFTGSYRLSRGRRSVTLTGAQILAARACRAKADATLEECRAALRPLAKLPENPQAAADEETVYEFPGDEASRVAVTNAMIQRAQQLVEA